MQIAIVKYNAGNVESVKNALNRLGIEPILTDDAEALKSADKVIFPGVGEASSAMKYLRERNLDATIKSLRQPVLGICLGNAAFVRIFGRKRHEMFGDSAVSREKICVRRA
jgi:glutamine amidotransferase